MASVVHEANGRISIAFTSMEGKRLRIRLGLVSEDQAAEFRDKVEKLMAAQRLGAKPATAVAHWVKTEHHAGGDLRYIPLFPELRTHLQAVFNETEDRQGHVITRYRQANANLRTQLNRYIKKAGLTPWPKLFNG